MRRVILIILVLIFITACSQLDSEEIVNSDEYVEPEQQYTDSSSEYTYEEGFDFVTMMNSVPYIVKAQVISIEKFNDTTLVARTNVIMNVKGDLEGEFDLYVDFNQVIEGGEYLLFLDYYNSPFYPNRVYYSYIFAEVEDENLSNLEFNGDKGALEISTVDEMIVFLKDNGENNTEELISQKIMILSTESDKELIEQSEYICVITPERIVAENPLFNLYSCSVKQNYKGVDSITINVSLPLETELGEEYLVFLNWLSGDHYEINSLNSIFKTKNEEYLNILEQLSELGN